MRPSLMIAVVVLSACGGGQKTCEELLLPDYVDDYYEVDLANESSGIVVSFTPAAAAEIMLKDDAGEVWWDIRCDVDPDDEDVVPACLTGSFEIGDDAPAGASHPVETQDLEEGPTYYVEVLDYDAECAGQIRSGKSQQFTVTIGSPF